MPAPLPQQVWGKIWKDLVLLEPPAPMQKLTRPGDEAAQGLAHGDPQVWALADGRAQSPCQPFEGGGNVCGPCAEPRQEGPDLEREGMT